MDYKDSGKKTALLKEMAARLSVPHTGMQLRTWLESIRTSASKLMKQGPSGTAKRNPTEKEQWICAHFGFLVDHITRIPSRQGSNLLAKKIGKKTPQDVENSSSAAEESGPQDNSDDPRLHLASKQIAVGDIRQRKAREHVAAARRGVPA